MFPMPNTLQFPPYEANFRKKLAFHVVYREKYIFDWYKHSGLLGSQISLQINILIY